jgi:hypothetical protein
MKTTLMLLSLGLAGSACLAADLKTELQAATKKLADQPNYSWTTTSKSDGSGANFRMGPFEGKIEKDGCTFVSGSFGDTQFEVVRKGDKFALKQDGEWKSAADLEDGERMARRVARFKAPAAEAEELAGFAKTLKQGADGMVSGDLTDEGIKELVGRWGRSRVESKEVNGSVKFWLQGGSLVKYEYKLQGKITVGQDEREMEIDRTTAVEIKAVGKTKLDLPAEAKKKLS